METHSEGNKTYLPTISAKHLTQSRYLLSDLTDRSCNVYPKDRVNKYKAAEYIVHVQDIYMCDGSQKVFGE